MEEVRECQKRLAQVESDLDRNKKDLEQGNKDLEEKGTALTNVCTFVSPFTRFGFSIY